MTYDLYIGDYAYSSWSLRGWLLFEKFGISRKTHLVDFSSRDVAAQLTGLAPARTVPTVKTPEGAVISESLAIAEELATRHPEAGLWPDDPAPRAVARSLSAEMHSGFTALRNQCPMGLRQAYDWSSPSEEVLDDLARLESLWDHARTIANTDGPWLFGAYCAADAFFAPVAARIAGFSLPVGAAGRAYVANHLADLAFRRWRAMGMVSGNTLDWYAQPYPVLEWPGPAGRNARATDDTDAMNQACPYSGKPVTHFLEMDGNVYGFCNAFCRDKTVADPEAWPAFMALVQAN